MTVRELKEKLKGVSDSARVRIQVDNPDPIFSNSGNLYDLKDATVEVSEGCSFRDDDVVIKEA